MANTATFLGVDTTTLGNWVGVYGSDGYQVYNGTTSLPAYVSVAITTGSPFVASPTSTDPRAVFTSSVSGIRTLAWWGWPQNGGSLLYTLAMTFTVNDGNSHNLAIYSCDYTNSGYVGSITMVDAATGLTLTSQSVTPGGVNGGVYFLYQISGTVKFYCTAIPPQNYGLFSGIFFGAFTPPASSTIPMSDVTNTGNWQFIPSVSDDFSGNSLDGTKWFYPPFVANGAFYGNYSPGNASSCYMPPSNFSFSNSILTTPCTYLGANGTTGMPPAAIAIGFKAYTGSSFQSLQTFLYGYFECRCQMPNTAYDSGPWMRSVGADGSLSTGDVFELDVCEISAKQGTGGAITANTLYNTIHPLNQSQVQSTWVLPSDCSQGFNVYGMSWNPTTVNFYFNGIQISTHAATANIPLAFLWAAGTNGTWTGTPLTADFPTSAQIDYMRVWQQAPYLQNFGGTSTTTLALSSSGRTAYGNTTTPGSFSGTLAYSQVSATQGRLAITIQNTTDPSRRGSIVGVGFVQPSGASISAVAITYNNTNFDVVGGPTYSGAVTCDAGTPVSNFGNADFGLAIGGRTWNCPGVSAGGMRAGLRPTQMGTVVMTLTGTNMNAWTAGSWHNTTSGSTPVTFPVKFRWLNDAGVQSATDVGGDCYISSS